MTPPLSPDVLARLRAMLGAAAPAEHTRAPEGGQSATLGAAESRIPEGTEPWMRAMYTSPMADSTYQVAGVPAVLDELPERLYARAAGRVSGKGDTLSMHPFRDLWDGAYNLVPADGHDEPRDTFLHEQGHRYAGLDRREEPAEAFMRAFDVLSKTGSDTAGMGAMLDSADSRFPGTRGMSDRLLREPLFADHPAAGGQGARRTATLEQIFGTHLRDK